MNHHSQDLITTFDTDTGGKPSGGHIVFLVTGERVSFQKGMIEGQRNGIFVEELIEAARLRLDYFQKNGMSCRENALAITKLEEALHWLDHRSNSRHEQGVINSYNSHT